MNLTVLTDYLGRKVRLTLSVGSTFCNTLRW
jgi:hypothetical protein